MGILTDLKDCFISLISWNFCFHTAQVVIQWMCGQQQMYKKTEKKIHRHQNLDLFFALYCV